MAQTDTQSGEGKKYGGLIAAHPHRMVCTKRRAAAMLRVSDGVGIWDENPTHGVERGDGTLTRGLTLSQYHPSPDRRVCGCEFCSE